MSQYSVERIRDGSNEHSVEEWGERQTGFPKVSGSNPSSGIIPVIIIIVVKFHLTRLVAMGQKTFSTGSSSSSNLFLALMVCKV